MLKIRFVGNMKCLHKNITPGCLVTTCYNLKYGNYFRMNNNCIDLTDKSDRHVVKANLSSSNNKFSATIHQFMLKASTIGSCS